MFLFSLPSNHQKKLNEIVIELNPNVRINLQPEIEIRQPIYFEDLPNFPSEMH